jgi:hypothetical protein
MGMTAAATVATLLAKESSLRDEINELDMDRDY